MSKYNRVQGETTDEAFQEQCFLWERGAYVGADFDLFMLQYSHTQEPKKKIEKNWSPLTLL